MQLYRQGDKAHLEGGGGGGGGIYMQFKTHLGTFINKFVIASVITAREMGTGS